MSLLQQATLEFKMLQPVGRSQCGEPILCCLQHGDLGTEQSSDELLAAHLPAVNTESSNKTGCSSLGVCHFALCNFAMPSQLS